MRHTTKTFSPFKVRLQTRRLTSGAARRETRRPEPPRARETYALACAA
jgi:hypothetical protein